MSTKNFKITCDNYDDFCSDYYEKALDTEQTLAFENHINECPKCKENYDAFVNMMNELSSVEDIEPPKDFHKNLMATLTTELQTKPIDEPISSDIANEPKENKFILFLERILNSNNKKLIYSGGLACVVLTFALILPFALSSDDQIQLNSSSPQFSSTDLFNDIETEAVENSKVEEKPLDSPMVTRATKNRSSFEPYDTTENLLTGYINVTVDASQKNAEKIFQSFEEDENIRVLSVNLSNIHSYSRGATTYDIDEFIKVIDNKNTSYNYTQHSIKNDLEYYNSIMTATNNKINLLEQSKANLKKQKDINIIENEIINLESNMDRYKKEVDLLLKTTDQTIFNINVNNESDIWKDGFFTTIKNDFVFAINTTFILCIVLIVITVALFILKLVFQNKTNETALLIIQKGSIIAKAFGIILAFIMFGISISHVISQYRYSTYNIRYSSDVAYTNEIADEASTDSAFSKTDEKVAYYGHINTEVKNISKAVDELKEIITTYDVSVTNSNLNSDNNHYTTFNLRVTNENYETVYAEISTIGTITNSNKEEVTHTDTITRYEENIASIKETRESYVSSLQQSTKTDTILDLANRVYNLDTEMYFASSYLDNLNEDVEYSTLTVTLTKATSDLIFLQNDFFAKAIHFITLAFACILSFAIVYALPLLISINIRKLFVKLFKLKQ